MHDAFYLSLTQLNLLSEEQYDKYLKDASRFDFLWDYLIHYNDTYFEIMVKPLVNLINMNAKYRIDCNRYDVETKKIINYYTSSIITHTVSFDGSSLYHSSFSSIFHPFNPYTSHVMWMQRSLIKEYECSSKVDLDLCMKLITDSLPSSFCHR